MIIFNKPLTGALPVADPHAYAYIRAAGYSNRSLMIAIDKLFRRLKGTITDLNPSALDVFSDIYVLNLMLTDLVGGSSAAMLAQMKYNAVNPATYLSTYVNSPTASLAGILGNGTNQYINTIFNASLLGTPSDLAFGCYICAASANTNILCDMGIDDSAGHQSRLVSRYTDNLNFTASHGGVDSTGHTLSDERGIYLVNRQSTSSFKVHRNESVAFTTSGTFVLQPNLSFYLFTKNISNNPDMKWSDRRYCGYWFTKGLSDAKALAFQKSINAFQGDVETIFGLAANSRKTY